MTLPSLDPTTTLADTQARLAQWCAVDWPAPPQGPEDEDPVADAVMWLAHALNGLRRANDPIPARLFLDPAIEALWPTLMAALPAPLGTRWAPDKWLSNRQAWPFAPQLPKTTTVPPVSLWVGVVQTLDQIEEAQALLCRGLRLPPQSGALHYLMLVRPQAPYVELVASDWQDQWNALRAAGAHPCDTYGLAFTSAVGTLAHLAVDLAQNQIAETHAFHRAIVAQAHAEGLDLAQCANPLGGRLPPLTAEAWAWALAPQDADVLPLAQWLQALREAQALVPLLAHAATSPTQRPRL